MEETNRVESMKNTIELNEANFEPEVLHAAVRVVVDFYAPWCGPCKMLAPVLEQLAGAYVGRLKFARANVEDTPDLAASFEVSGVPTLMLLRGGKAVDQVIGFSGLRQLKGVVGESGKHNRHRYKHATHHDSAHHYWNSRRRRTWLRVV